MANNLNEKIKTLISYRRLPDLCALAGESWDWNSSLVKGMIDLQRSIYELDHVLETVYDVLEVELAAKWNHIYKCLTSLGINPKDHDHYCRHIYRYQRHELSQREGKPILRYDLEYFYYYKSCDVKLLRRILYENYPNLHHKISLGQWRAFDLFTELNDDIEDVYEDIGTINGNRFLKEIERYGISQAFESFSVFLEKISEKYVAKLKSNKGQDLLIEATHEEYIATRKLLVEREKAIRMNGLALKPFVENS